MTENDSGAWSPEELARGDDVSGWHNWSIEGYIGLAIRLWECHTDGSPALGDIWDRWSIRGVLSTEDAQQEIWSLIEPLDDRLDRCCSIPDENDDDEDLPYCQRCESMHIAVCAALAVTSMVGEKSGWEDCINAVRWAHGKHLRYEGARDGFGTPGRYTRPEVSP